MLPSRTLLESADLTVKNSNISSTGLGSLGSAVYLNNSTINIADSVISTAHGYGIYAKNGSAVTVKGGSINKASGMGDEYGAYAEAGSSLDISGSNIVVSGDRDNGVGVKQNSLLKYRFTCSSNIAKSFTRQASTMWQYHNSTTGCNN